MKKIIIVCFLLLGNITFAQNKDLYNKIKYKSFSSLDNFVATIQSLTSNQYEQAVITYYYCWLNISYDLELARQIEKMSNDEFYNNPPYETNYDIILRNKTGTCTEKSILFYTVCTKLNISCIMVYGTLKIGGTHYWNSFTLNGDIYVIDATNHIFIKNQNSPMLLAESIATTLKENSSSELNVKKVTDFKKIILSKHINKPFYTALEMYLSKFYTNN